MRALAAKLLAPTRAFALLLSALVGLLPGRGWANISEMITALGAAGGDAVWKIVRQSSEGDSQLEAGVYSRGPRQTWDHLLVKGHVLGREHASGLVQLSLTEFTGRLEAWAIVDGRIHLFHITSSAAQPDSVIVLGDTRHPIVDPVQPYLPQVLLPVITSLDDINFIIRQPDGEPKGQDLVFSLRMPASPYPERTGLTFALRLKGGDGARLELASPISILDYRFHSKDELSKLVQTEGYTSLNFLTQHLQIQRHDSLPLRLWKRDCENIRSQGQFSKLPIFKLQEQSFDLAIYPEFFLTLRSPFNRFQNLQVKASYPWQGSSAKIDFIGERETHSVYGEFNLFADIAARADSLSWEKMSKYIMIKNDSFGHMLAFINSQLHLIKYHENGDIYATILPFHQRHLPKDYDFKIIPRDDNKIHILLSMAYDSERKTYLYALSSAHRSLICEMSLAISDNFYSAAQLSERLYKSRDDDYYFDDHTGVDPHIVYKYSYQQNFPHVDIEESIHQAKKVIGFRQPLVTNKLTSGLVFHTYNAPNRPEDFNGIYFEEAPKKFKKLLGGELLRLEAAVESMPSKSNSSSLLAERKLLLGNGEVTVSVFAIDKTFSHGEKRFDLVFVSQYDAPSQNLIPKVYTVEIPYPATAFEGIKLHGGNYASKNEQFLGALASFHDDKLPEKRQLLFIDMYLRTSAINLGSPSVVYELAIDNSHKFLAAAKQLGGHFDELFGKLLSDVYQSGQDGKLTTCFYGERLQSLVGAQAKAGSPLQDSFALDSKEWTHPEWGPLRLDVYAVDDRFSHGEAAFSLVIKVLRRKDNVSEYHTSTISVPFTALVGLSLHTASDYSNHKEHKDKFGVIYALDAPSSRRFKAPSGFYSIFFTANAPLAERQEQAHVFFNRAASTILEVQEHPSIEEISTKLMVNPEGELFWPANDFQASHRQFQATSLFKIRTIYPNQVRMPLEVIKKSPEMISYRALEGSWRVRKASLHQKAKLPNLFAKLDKEDLDEYRNVVFEDLGNMLTALADPASPGQHTALLVSREVKKYVLNTVVAKWLLKEEEAKSWSHTNTRLALHYLHQDQAVDQEVIVNNFKGMADAIQRREKVVLLVDMQDIINIGRPKLGNVDIPYEISVPDMRIVNHGKQETDEHSFSPIYSPSPSETKKEIASLLYILASEGRVIPLADFSQRGPHELSILLVGTPEEWQEVRLASSNFERRHGLMENFNEHRLNTPSQEQRRNLLLQVIEERAHLFQNVHYRSEKIFLSPELLSTEQIKEKVLDYAVSRSQALAEEKGENIFVAFVKLLHKWKASLSTEAMRDLGLILKIDKDFIENIMCELYGLPLNLRSLPANDPLKILAQKDAPMKLSEAGYSGNFDIKMRIIRGILAQTNSGDQKTIPASFVIFGKKGSGKTHLFKSLVNMLGLKYYNFAADAEVNQNAQVFVVNLGNITSGIAGNEQEAESLTLAKMLEDFDKFLKLPKGKRGFILFDDAHLASSEIRGEVFAKLRSLFEARDGMYRGVNVRNLSLFMTFNPTADREKIRKIVSYGEPSPLQLTVATFLGNDNKVDESFFNRWGDIINLDFFSTSAKGDELSHKLAATIKSHFNIESRYFTATTDVIAKIVKKFPNVNARDFLSSSVKALEELVRKADSQRNLFLVIPKQKYPYRGGWEEAKVVTHADASQEEIADFIRDNFYAVGIDQNMRSFAFFMEMLTHNFRIHLYQDLVRSINSDAGFIENSLLQKHRLLPVLEALKAHLKDNTRIPLFDFPLDQYKIRQNLGLSNFEKIDEHLFKLYKEADPNGYFPAIFSRSVVNLQAADYLLGQADAIELQATRLNLLQETPKLLKGFLDDYLMRLLFVQSKQDLTAAKIRSWASKRTLNELENTKPAIDRIVQECHRFMHLFLDDKSLIENLNPSDYPQASNYDTARIFFLALDKAITMVAWEEVSIFFIKALDLFSQDMSIATNPGVQYWLFDAVKTLIRPVFMENIFEHVKSSLLGTSEWSDELASRRAGEFKDKLDGLFFTDNQ